ncbi:Hypothetical predicted protein, partial [Mytilus galloprovincialis]
MATTALTTEVMTMAPVTTITTEAITHSGSKRCALGWKSYVEQFRLRMSQDPVGSWAVDDPELWLRLLYMLRIQLP